MIDKQWDLAHVPPKGHPDVAEFAFQLFEIARMEKERLGKPQDFLSNYAMYRGRKDAPQTGRKGYSPKQQVSVPVNLFFSNIERTVSNITARVPTGEVVDLDGMQDGLENVLSMQLKKWWKETDQQLKTRKTAREMEIYGATIEKPVRNPETNQPDIIITDPFQFFPAPGNWEDISTEAPYACYAYLDYVSAIEQGFGVKNVASDEAYDLMGQQREEYKGGRLQQSIGNYADPMSVRKQEQAPDKKLERGILIEVWVRDNRETTEKLSQPLVNEVTGGAVVDENGIPQVIEASRKVKACPDGVRKITITKTKDPSARCGWIVVDDSPNPNINYRHIELGADVSSTYPWGRLPAYIANSYKDDTSIWGFSASEQVGDLLGKISLIITKLVAYVINVMTPPLIVQQHCGITREMIETSIQKAGRLILMPSTPTARIEFMTVPNLPETFFKVLDLLVMFFDRVYQIEDADRGVAPTGVIAASAIVALQERNQVLMQAKTASIDRLAEERSRWAIGIWQNFGVEEESVNVNGEPVVFRPVDLIGRRFNFVVESGSTTPRTSLQIQEQAASLANSGFIDRRALLETINFPNWQQIIERMGETQLDSALQVLIDSGLPEETAMQLRQVLMQPQGGPGDVKKPGQSGKPKAQQ